MNKIILSNTDVEKNVGELSGEYLDAMANQFGMTRIYSDEDYQSGLSAGETDSKLRQRASEKLNLGDF